MATVTQTRMSSGILQILKSSGGFRALFPTVKHYSSQGSDKSDQTFDVRMLDVLACPLSKKPLRYDAVNNELVCDELSVAYPIVNGIPNLNPHDGRMLKKVAEKDTDHGSDS